MAISGNGRGGRRPVCPCGEICDELIHIDQFLAPNMDDRDGAGGDKLSYVVKGEG